MLELELELLSDALSLSLSLPLLLLSRLLLALPFPLPLPAFLSSIAFNLFLSSSLACRILSANPILLSFLNSSGRETLGSSRPNLPFSSCCVRDGRAW